MNESDFDNRKHTRRENIEKKGIDKGSKRNDDALAAKKLKKEFKRTKESLRQEELWEEWQDEIS